MPALPDKHSYTHTPTFSTHDTDPRGQQLQRTKQRRLAEKSLISLQEKAYPDAPTNYVDKEMALWGEEAVKEKKKKG